MARLVSGVSVWPRSVTMPAGILRRGGGFARPEVLFAGVRVVVCPMPGTPEEVSCWGGWSWARDWVVVLRGLRRLSSSSLSAGPILPVSCCAAFAWFYNPLVQTPLKEDGGEG